jgi:DNA-binding beta-propeller fold protein YncE
MRNLARFVSVAALFLASPIGARAEGPPPLLVAQVIALPRVEGRIDHMAVDPAGKRLFVSALGNGSLEVLDLQAGKRVRSIPGLKEPQGVAYVPALHRVVVANAGGTVVTFEEPSFQTSVILPRMDDADNLRIDEAADQLYVGYGDGALGIVDLTTMKRIGDIQLPGHPESFRLERASPRLYVNVPRTKEILVVDRQKRAIVSRMALAGLAQNYPMFLDENHQRLFVGVRQPARLVVFDTQSGSRIAEVPCVGDTDDLFYDSERDRVYVIGGEGFVDVFDASENGRFPRIARLSTSPGARTGLWSPELRQLFVASPHRDGHEAAIRVYEAPVHQ